jgi:hypothetical protein
LEVLLSFFKLFVQCDLLRELVGKQTPWSEIAMTMNKSERKVKYQWCYLLSRELKEMSRNRRDGNEWSQQLVRSLSFIFYFVFESVDKL